MRISDLPKDLVASVRRGLAIPAHPLALDRNGRLDERHQRALTRYYVAAGAGGVAVGVHTTQFEIRDKGLYEPVLSLAVGEIPPDRLRVAGLCGDTAQAVCEAETAVSLGYHAGLLNLSSAPDPREIAKVIPLFGFYLQPAVGGKVLPYSFWRSFAEIENVLAIKIAPFNRYQTLDVVRAVRESGREIALYTGNDDHIVLDLLAGNGIVGGLLGHGSVWTKRFVEMFEIIRSRKGDLFRLADEVTDANAALFDAANGFAGCIPGLHAVLVEQGLMTSMRCLDPKLGLSPGQAEEIARVRRAYPHLVDDDFVRENLDRWLA